MTQGKIKLPEAREKAGDQVAIGFKSNLRLSLFYFISPYDWYRKLASLSQPIRFKTEIYSWLDHPPYRDLGSLLVFLMSSHWLFFSSFDRSRKFSKPIMMKQKKQLHYFLLSARQNHGLKNTTQAYWILSTAIIFYFQSNWHISSHFLTSLNHTELTCDVFWWIVL